MANSNNPKEEPTKKKGGDYEGWILRLIDKIEDLKFSFTLQDWLNFASDKIEPRQGYDLTDRQKASLNEYRAVARDRVEAKTGIKVQGGFRYRSAITGKFVKRTPAGFRERGKFVRVRSEPVTVYRSARKGTMVAAGAINEYIDKLKTEKRWNK